MIEAPGADAFAGGRLDARGFGRHEPGALDFLTGAALCLPRAAWERVGPFDERLFLYYEDVEWCLRARAAGFALRVEPTCDGAARRRQLDGRRAGRDLGLLLDAQPAVAAAAAARARHRAARGREHVGARAAAAARADRPRQARGRARLGRGPHGAGALSPVRVAFDGVVFTQSRAGSARVARGSLDALPAVAPDVEIVPVGRGGVRRPRQRAPEGSRRVRQDVAWYGDGLGRAARRARSATCCTARHSGRRCAGRACRWSRRCTISQSCASRAGSRPGAGPTAAG